VARCALARPPTATRRGGRRGATSPQLRRWRGGSMPSGARPRPDSPSPSLFRRPRLLLPDVGGGVPLPRRRRVAFCTYAPTPVVMGARVEREVLDPVYTRHLYHHPRHLILATDLRVRPRSSGELRPPTSSVLILPSSCVAGSDLFHPPVVVRRAMTSPGLRWRRAAGGQVWRREEASSGERAAGFLDRSRYGRRRAMRREGCGKVCVQAVGLSRASVQVLGP
jgi:hypothetical protein